MQHFLISLCVIATLPILSMGSLWSLLGFFPNFKFEVRLYLSNITKTFSALSEDDWIGRAVIYNKSHLYAPYDVIEKLRFQLRSQLQGRIKSKKQFHVVFYNNHIMRTKVGEIMVSTDNPMIGIIKLGSPHVRYIRQRYQNTATFPNDKPMHVTSGYVNLPSKGPIKRFLHFKRQLHRLRHEESNDGLSMYSYENIPLEERTKFVALTNRKHVIGLLIHENDNLIKFAKVWKGMKFNTLP